MSNDIAYRLDLSISVKNSIAMLMGNQRKLPLDIPLPAPYNIGELYSCILEVNRSGI